MAERSIPWAGIITGDCGPYTDADWSIVQSILGACSRWEGVASNYLNSLTGSVGGANTVNIASGGALVDGKVYQNTDAVAVNIPSAVGGGNTRIDRIVLRANWTAQTVRITRIAGVDAGSPTAPAITQTSGTTYDVMLYQALVDTGGTVTLTDERVTTSLTVMRQGAAGNWGENDGSSNFSLVGINVGIQVGCALSGANPITVTFPRAFAVKPLVFVTAVNFPPGYQVGVLNATSATTCTISAMQTTSGDYVGNLFLNWMAIGPLA